jgi:hypothetical protein
MKSRSYKITVKLLWVVSISLYLTSLTQECYCTTNACGDNWSGASIMVLGAIGGIMSIAGLTWYANPLLWLAWSLTNKNPKKAFFFSLGAAVLAASFLLARKISDTQAGKSYDIIAYRPGYWLWLASMIATVVGTFILYMWSKAEMVKIKTETLWVDFQNMGNEGVRLIGKGTLDELDNKKIKLYGGLQLIIWQEDNNKKVDNLAVEAAIKYSDIDKCWVAEFDKDELKHESERKRPLLSAGGNK